MKLQFNHKRRHKNGVIQPRGGKTTAMEEMSKSTFDEFFNGQCESSVYQIGVANCLSTDNYSKERGRFYASLKLANQKVRIDGKGGSPDGTRTITLACPDLGIKLKLRSLPNSNRIYFEEVV